MLTFHEQTWKWVFRVKGVWNCVLTVVLYFFDDALRMRLGMPLIDPVYRTMFLALAFVFGVGYWRVARDLSRGEGVAYIGVLGQAAVFVIVTYYFLQGHVHWLYLGPAIVDLVFSVLFGMFLLQRIDRRSSA